VRHYANFRVSRLLSFVFGDKRVLRVELKFYPGELMDAEVLASPSEYAAMGERIAGYRELVLAVDPKDSRGSQIGDRYPVVDNDETFA
jgi:hypothetical protein